ncbi:MAG: ParA family protein [Drouetiella hepatica Uher 2000/2452]|uniref:ParA family protein n=1 Tax=Drouetiella hepatica Uher 2000/2452 TaxID=904376 RepID=A0A951QGN3_9CYAN|nr:ParA family protein [Drouetiella hepatica Uher 2000/2452]
MAILTLTGFKGGVGKTTSAICIACLLGSDTLLIDSDPNRSATLWARKGKLPFRVCDEKEAPKLLSRNQYKNIIIDTPARPAQDEIESLAKGCDLMILPTSPEPLAIAALAQIASSLPVGTQYRALLTMCPPSPQKDGREALDALQKQGLPVFERLIRRYKVYIKASDLGLPVASVPGSSVAWSDWKELYKELKEYV